MTPAAKRCADPPKTSSATIALAAFVEIAVLLGVILFLGVTLIPAHWTSIWGDREFTGWVAPISLRIANGQKLYADGAHSPMPPLSFVTLRILFGSRVNWIDESLVNFLCQCGILLAGYCTLSRWLPRPVPFAAAVAGAAWIFSLPKTILYDSQAQFLAAICIALTGEIAWRRLIAKDQSVSRVLPVILGLCLSMLTLTKQSTLTGTVAGVFVALAVLYGWKHRTEGLRAMTIVVAAWLAGFIVVSAAISPWVSVSSMIRDVYVS